MRIRLYILARTYRSLALPGFLNFICSLISRALIPLHTTPNKQILSRIISSALSHRRTRIYYTGGVQIFKFSLVYRR